MLPVARGDAWDTSACCCWLQVLKAKQGSSQQYSSQAERDAHLKKHIKQLNQAATGQKEQINSLRQQQEEMGSALNDLASVSAGCCQKSLLQGWCSTKACHVCPCARLLLSSLQGFMKSCVG